MATLTGARAASTFPVPGLPEQGVQGMAWGIYNATTALAQNDVIEFCKIPAGATVVGGYFQAADIDTGTETLDIDIGWAANGTDSADPDGFGNLGVLTGDASVHLPVAGIYAPFVNVIQDSGYKTFAAETKITATVNAAANMGGTGVMKMVVYYVGGGITTP